MQTCPDCKCQFVQPFKCITCGAEKLYDHTVRSQAGEIQRLQAKLDAIMLEYCPNEMTPQQIARWEDAQTASQASGGTVDV